MIPVRIPVKPDDFAEVVTVPGVVSADMWLAQIIPACSLTTKVLQIQHTQQLSTEVLHSNRLELLLPLLQYFIFIFFLNFKLDFLERETGSILCSFSFFRSHQVNAEGSGTWDNTA